jgi:hypothetical protein
MMMMARALEVKHLANYKDICTKLATCAFYVTAAGLITLEMSCVSAVAKVDHI